MIYKDNPLKGIVARYFRGKAGREKEQFADLVIDAELGEDYIISNYGRVFCANTNEEIVPYYFPHREKYKTVKLKGYHKGTDVVRGVNILVAEAFIPRTKRDIELGRDTVHVLDWNKSNSRYTNLVWANHFEISIYTSMRDDDSTENLVKCICMLLVRGYTQKEIEKIVGVPVKRSLINSIKKHKILPEITSKYDFD